jgi:glycosyltransferase involved in cell wall biosynthesis
VRILIYPNSLQLGGSLNAIEIAAVVRDLGHEVTVTGPPGPLVPTVQRLGLDYVPMSADLGRRPSARAASALTQIARECQIDLVHGYEWPQIVESCAGPRLRLRLPAVCTVYSEVVAPFLPRTMPYIVCAPAIAALNPSTGRSPVTVVRAPVDLRANAPGSDPGPPFWPGIGREPGPLLVVVSRLAHELKLEGLLAACDAMGKLAAAGIKAQLAVIGDGPARHEVEQAAAEANAVAGRRVVIVAGELADPRPAYAAADIVLGMGGSALRGMAFAKPVVIQGERGFWRLLTADSAPLFLHEGWYGLGPQGQGRQEGAARLEAILAELLARPRSWAELGEYGRSLVARTFDLERAAASVAAVYAGAADAGAPGRHRLAADAAHAWAGAVRHQARRKWRRWRGYHVPSDDFNSLEAKAQAQARAERAIRRRARSARR